MYSSDVAMVVALARARHAAARLSDSLHIREGGQQVVDAAVVQRAADVEQLVQDCDRLLMESLAESTVDLRAP